MRRERGVGIAMEKYLGQRVEMGQRRVMGGASGQLVL